MQFLSSLLRRTALFFAAFVLLGTISVFAMLGTGGGRGITANLISGIASGDDLKIEIAGLNSVLGNRIEIEKISLSDRDGIWATAHNLSVDYRLSDVLFGSIRIDNADLELLNIDRQPVPAANSTPSAPLSWPTQLLPSPLNALSVQNLKIDKIELGSSIAGTPAELTLSGTAVATNEPLRTEGNISVVQLDNANGTVFAKWSIDPLGQTANVNLKLSEDRNGILANLLSIPNRPAINASIDGSGPLADWSSKLEVTFNDKPVIIGAAKIGLKETGQSISATLNGQLAPLLPKSLLPLVAGKTDIAISASRDGDGNIQVSNASLASALAQVQSSGIYSLTQNRVDLNATVKIGNEGEIVSFERTPGVFTRLGEVKLTSKISGTINEATLQVEGALASFEENGIDLSGAKFTVLGQKIDIENVRGNVSLNAKVDALATGTEIVDQLLDGGIDISSEIQLAENANAIDIASLNLRTRAISSDLIGRHDLASSQTQLANKTIINAVSGTLISQLFGKQVGLIESELSLAADGSIDAKTLSIKSANLNASGSGSLGAGEVGFDGKIGLADLNQFSPELEGALSLTAKANGNISNPSFQLELLGNSLKVAGNPLDDLKGTITGSTLDAIDVKLNANYEATPIKASARVSAADAAGPRKIDAISIQVPGADISGEVTIGSAGLMAGFADLNFEDFSKLAPLLLQTNFSGSAAGKAELYVENGKQVVALNMKAPALSYDGTTLSNLALKALINDAFGAPSPQIDIRLGRAVVAGETLSNSVLTVTSGQGNWPIALNSNLNGKPLEMSALVRPDGAKLVIDIDTLSLNYRAIPVVLGQPIKAVVDGDLITLSAPQIAVAGGNISASGTISDQFDIAVRVDGLSMSAIEGVAKTGLAPNGTINATANITGARVAPVINYQIDGRNLSGQPIRDAGLASLNVSGTGSLKENTLATNLAVSGGGLDIIISGSTNIAAQTLNFGVKGVAPFSYVARPLTRSGVVLSGSANVDATATGTFARPNIQGQISTSGARFTEIASRIRVTDLSGILLFNGDSAKLSQISGRLSKNGQFAANGNLSLRPADKLQSDFTLTIRNGEYDDGSTFSTIFDADLALTGRLAEAAVITGQINVDRTDIIIPETLPNVVSPVAVTHKNASAAINEQAASLTPQQGQDAGSPMALNIQVNAPKRIFVRGRGLDAELGGNLNIGGTTSNPRIKGAINMSRGRMEILTKRFDFDTGRMVFAGPADPSLDFTASTRLEGSTYSIFVRGLASAPEFSFGSSPSLPQDQIVAKLFFGRSLADLSALQLVQLANAVGTLNGSNSGPSLLDRLRAAAGLDDVDIKTNEQGQTTVGVGAYLNDRTYVNVEKGTEAGSGKVTIDLNITDNITARGETSESGETKAGVFYETDY